MKLNNILYIIKIVKSDNFIIFAEECESSSRGVVRRRFNTKQKLYYITGHNYLNRI